MKFKGTKLNNDIYESSYRAEGEQFIDFVKKPERSNIWKNFQI